MPIRVQRKRTPGYRTPLCSCGCGKPAIYVGRPGPLGNRWRVGGAYRDTEWERRHFHGRDEGVPIELPWSIEKARQLVTEKRLPWFLDQIRSRQQAVNLYRRDMEFWADEDGDSYEYAMDRIRGHDLTCWCAEGSPCHADVLLELAARGGEQP